MALKALPYDNMLVLIANWQRVQHRSVIYGHDAMREVEGMTRVAGLPGSPGGLPIMGCPSGYD